MLRDPTHLYEGTPSPRAEKIARIVSVLFSPTIFSTIPFVLFGLRIEDPATSAACIVCCVALMVVLPTAMIAYYAAKYRYDDGDISRKEDRTKPMLAGALMYAACLVMVYLMVGMDLLTVMMICYTVSILLVGAVTLRWKISIHAVGIVGPSIGLYFAYPPYGILAILALVPVVWARYILKRHTPAQLAAGIALAAITTLVLFSILARWPGLSPRPGRSR